MVRFAQRVSHEVSALTSLPVRRLEAITIGDNIVACSDFDLGRDRAVALACCDIDRGHYRSGIAIFHMNARRQKRDGNTSANKKQEGQMSLKKLWSKCNVQTTI